jgi:transposase-like protein
MARPHPHLRNRRKEHHWRQLLARYQHSGLTVRAFCSREGCSEPSFYAWRRELAARDQQATSAQRPNAKSPPAQRAFVPVHIVADDMSASRCLEVVLRSGHLLRVPAGCDVAWLRQLIAQLEQPIC